MRLAQYAKAARQTAVYEAKLRIIIPSLGLAGEVGELLAALTSDDGDEAICDEMGDVLWYVANLAIDCNIPIHQLVEGCETCAEIEDRGLLPGAHQFVMLATDVGAICGLVKKLYRDDHGSLTPDRREKIRAGLEMILLRLAALTTFRKWSLGKIARENIAKVIRCQSDGTLHVAGANR
jgi:NTP pyrophosphatase (non-canonical NTP hydrolase)